MKKADVQIGQVYMVKVSGQLSLVRLTRVNPHGGWYGLNLRTNRTLHIRSAARLRYKHEEHNDG